MFSVCLPILSPPTVNRVRLGSAFSGRTVHTNCPYVTSFNRSVGTSCWNINLMVLVGFFIRPPMPFANHPNLLADERLRASLYFVLLINCLLHASLYFLLLINCLKLSSCPVSASMTDIA